MSRGLILILAGYVVAFFMLGMSTAMIFFAPEPATPLPRCAEDVVLIGYGDFEDGRWEYLTCGPARDSYREDRP